MLRTPTLISWAHIYYYFCPCRFDHIYGMFRTAAGKVRRLDVILAPPDEWAYGLVGEADQQYLSRINGCLKDRKKRGHWGGGGGDQSCRSGGGWNSPHDKCKVAAGRSAQRGGAWL